jgi:hypothetical protein
VDEPRRNDAFDRELRRTLAAGGGAPGAPHLDAELAAAWMDRQLDASTARSIEAHLADCADCQMMMATLARLSPEPPAASDGLAWWRRIRTGWLVPATVAATAALVIWVAIPEQRTVPTAPERAQALEDRAAPADQATQAAPAAADASAARPSAASPSVEPPPAAGREADADAGARRFASPPSEPQRKTANLDAAPPPPPAAAPVPPPAAPALERRSRDDAAAPAPESFKETITVTGEAPVVDAQSAARSAPAAGAAPARQEAAAAPPPQAERFRADSVGRAASLRASGALTVTAPGGARWRRLSSAFEFAPRAGAEFSAVMLPVPVEAVSAGMSPGGTVCWLVGTGGLVLVAVDGVRFVRVGAPVAIDLVAVTATDARTAIVTGADGRRFRTTDQGASWVVLR